MIEIYPVVHYNDAHQVVDQAGVALSEGADGVYLIDHRSLEPDNLVAAFNRVVATYPEAFVGLNLLQAADALSAFEMTKSLSTSRHPNALWVDNAVRGAADVESYRKSDPGLATICYLGGIAFKYTDSYTDDPEEAAILAARYASYVDVVTTSGEGTGHAPHPLKIAAMKQAIAEKPLAVASGISLENIADYAGSLDKLLVSTSIETFKSSGIFDQVKLRELIAAAHEL